MSDYVPHDPANEPERFQWTDENNQLFWLTQEEIAERENWNAEDLDITEEDETDV